MKLLGDFSKWFKATFRLSSLPGQNTQLFKLKAGGLYSVGGSIDIVKGYSVSVDSNGQQLKGVGMDWKGNLYSIDNPNLDNVFDSFGVTRPWSASNDFTFTVSIRGFGLDVNFSSFGRGLFGDWRVAVSPAPVQ